MEHVFRRTVPNIIKNTIYTFLSPAVLFLIVYIALSFFKVSETTTLLIAGGLTAVAFLMFAKSLFIDDRLVITVTESGMRYRSGSKETFYAFDDCEFGYKTVSSQGTTDTINLYVYRGDDEIFLNCEPLGPNQFSKLFELLKGHRRDQSAQKLN